LSAVLFMVVTSFGGFITHQPIGTFVGATKESQTIERLTFSSFTPDVRFEDCVIFIDPPGDEIDAGSPEVWDLATDYEAPYIYNTSVTLTIKDLAQDGKLSLGDYIAISWDEVAPTVHWTVKLVYAVSGAALATITFTI